MTPEEAVEILSAHLLEIEAYRALPLDLRERMENKVTIPAEVGEAQITLLLALATERNQR